MFGSAPAPLPPPQVMVSPIETAMETMEDKNKRISNELDQYRHNQQLRIDPLSMSLNGVVDPAVQGGIAKYKVRTQGTGMGGKSRAIVVRKIVLFLLLFFKSQ